MGPSNIGENVEGGGTQMYPDRPSPSKKRRAQRQTQQIGLGAIVVTVALCFGTVAAVSIVRHRRNVPAESLPLSSGAATSAAGEEDTTGATAAASASTAATTSATTARTTVTTASTAPATTARRTYAETPTTTGPTSAKIKTVGKRVLGDVPILWQQPDFPAGCESTAAVIAMRYAGESDLSVATFVDEYLEQGVVENGRGVDPNEVFAGSPRSGSGYGCFRKPIKRAMERYYQGRRQIVDATGLSLDELCSTYIDNGIPCIVWVTIGMIDAYYSSSWTLEDGSTYQRTLHGADRLRRYLFLFFRPLPRQTAQIPKMAVPQQARDLWQAVARHRRAVKVSARPKCGWS